MRHALTTAALATTLLCLALPATSYAADTKVHHGSSCKVFGSTAWTDLQFGASGIINLTNAPRNIICPLVKDDDAPWDGNAGAPLNAANVHLHWRTGPVAAAMACSVHVSDSEGVLLESTSFNSGVIGGFNQEIGDLIGLDTFGSGNHAQAMMLCTMGPRTALSYYYLFEQGDTN